MTYKLFQGIFYFYFFSNGRDVWCRELKEAVKEASMVSFLGQLAEKTGQVHEKVEGGELETFTFSTSVAHSAVRFTAVQGEPDERG